MKLMNIVGARPNFMKMASIIDAINKYNDSAPDPKFKNSTFISPYRTAL